MYGVTLWSGCYIYVISIMSLSAARLPSENFVINIYHLAPGLVPSDLRHFLDALVAQIGMHRRIRNYGINGIGHSIYVPVVGLDDIVKDFGAPALLGDNGWYTHLHGFQRRNTERLGHGGMMYTSEALSISYT